MELAADCSRCAGLCCVAPAFSQSVDFAYDKPAGRACVHLDDDFRCEIHPMLASEGFRGCAVFDCFGAGQHLVQGTFGGADWRAARAMLDLFPVMRQLHELAWHLDQARRLPEVTALRPALQAAFDETRRLADGTPADLAGLDVTAYRNRVNRLLRRASKIARAGAGPAPCYRGRDLVGRRMRGADLRGADLRGALLIAADLRDADLRRADFSGADLRGTDLRGADLTGALFLTEAQLRAARTTPPANRI
ncbi:pentapeptide repeat-containing protein [Mangrovihabitans endophyticus]|uniref:Pentapeptide repeat-containing protein n=1 Tax=Mangrovihabitans endophyticus TaxID=1751298 RepID=A0A8J3FQB0_9ACTN|nr:pentapeptide repeat-containing protein [Mangrovihabitans endophyticus]GGL01874.1 hypothetical protein GCM10012284_40550 [Mangrovihabitans endophyticus]